MSDDHDAYVWGPAEEGTPLRNGGSLYVPGWVWTCVCGQSQYGFLTQREAIDACANHLPSGWEMGEV